MKKPKGISYKVHPDFFNLYLEPNRKMFEMKFKVPISQVKTTELLINKIKQEMNKQLPKKRSRL